MEIREMQEFHQEKCRGGLCFWKGRCDTICAMQEVAYRLATLDDLEDLIELRAAFLAEVSAPVTSGSTSAPASAAALRDALTRYFSTSLAAGEFVAYVAVVGERIVASSGLVFHRNPPSMKNLNGCEAYVMNMYTLPEWRGQGIATMLLKKLIEFAKQRGCHHVSLHAFPNARPIYARAGFTPVDGEMRLDLTRH